MKPNSLKRTAEGSRRLAGMFSGAGELKIAGRAAMIAAEFNLLAAGNDLKFSDRLRPTPATYDFTYGDIDVAWAKQYGLGFRGHNLVWWNALPKWFSSYVTAANAEQVMTDHIKNVVGHYVGKIFSWDVINECIDVRTPSGFHNSPWLNFIGPSFIEKAFRAAHAADPNTKLIVNECFVEHDIPSEIARRNALLALVTRLKSEGVPIWGVGLQGHLKAAVPLDTKGLPAFLAQIEALGLHTMVTELDVDYTGIASDQVASAVAQRYGDFIDLVGPFVKVFTFEALADSTAEPNVGNLWAANMQKNTAYAAVYDSLAKLT